MQFTFIKLLSVFLYRFVIISLQFSVFILAVLLCTFSYSMAANVQVPAMAVDITAAKIGDNGHKLIPPIDLTKPLCYEDCIYHALLHSPYFAKSTIQIELDRIEERDARWKIFPNIEINGNFIVNKPDSRNSSPSKANFVVGSWDPMHAYFSIGAYKILTEIAVYRHLKVIAESLFSMADAFLRLEYMDKVAALINEEITLAEQEKAYTMNCYQNGRASTLDIVSVEHKIDRLTLYGQQNNGKRQNVLESLKRILGVPLDQSIVVNLKSSRNQIIGSFDPAAATLELAQRNSIDLKIKSLEKKVQHYYTIASYAQYIPKIQLGLRTDYSAYSNSDVLVSSIGLTTPLWDWGSRWRTISKEKHKLYKVEAETVEKEFDLNGEWRNSEIERQDYVRNLNLAYSALKLVNLKKQQAEIRYKSGTESYTAYLELLMALYESQIATLTAELQYDEALLKLRHITGDLYKSYVDASSL
ncbi:putative outer membrane efflux protein [Desulfovibrionales bacterium]